MNTTFPTRRRFISGLMAGAMASCVALHADEAQFAKALQPSLDELSQWFADGTPAARVQQQFLLRPTLSHLNTGTLGACPRVVVAAHEAFLRAIEEDPARLVFGELGAQMETVRTKAAAFLGADVDEVAFTNNTTGGLNMVAEGLELQAGDEVLTSTQEHGGGLAGWRHAAKSRGVVIREVALPTPAQSVQEIVAAVAGALTPRTRVVALSHVNTITGLRLPVEAIAELAAKNDAFLILDGAQSVGMLPINVHALGCDAYATSCHKWMLGPKGCGLLYVRRSFQDRISSVWLQDGMNAYTAATGTRNVPQILALGVALDVLNAIGAARIEAHDMALARKLREHLQLLPGIKIVSPEALELQSAITSFQLPNGFVSAAVAQTLHEKNIAVKPVPGDHLQNRGLRVSTHLYNTQRDLDVLVSELKPLAQ